MEPNTIYEGDALLKLRIFPDDSFDSCVTDPPYGWKFMNLRWDYKIPSVEVWKEIYRVMKPGAYLVCACGTRTQHRMAVNIEDAGFEIRDVITWHYAQGFPKNMDISKAIDKKAGATRKIIGTREHPTLKDKTKIDRHGNQQFHGENSIQDEWSITEAATEAAKQWDGWGTALKPATEFWTVARKPISESTIAENILKWGTGGINIDASRIEFSSPEDFKSATFGTGVDIKGGNYGGGKSTQTESKNIEGNPKGRFPANVIFDEFTAQILDDQTGELTSGMKDKPSPGFGDGNIYSPGGMNYAGTYGDCGGGSRFFYCAKADSAERNLGVDNNDHPTVKPVSLMRYLVKMVTQKGGICLDPYCGSGTTLIGAKLELMQYVGIDNNPRNVEISRARIMAWNPPKYIEQTLF